MAGLARNGLVPSPRLRGEGRDDLTTERQS